MDNDVDNDDNENENDTVVSDNKNELEKDLREIIENEVEDHKDVVVEEPGVNIGGEDDGFGDGVVEGKFIVFLGVLINLFVIL